jgi:hypothetical protein
LDAGVNYTISFWYRIPAVTGGGNPIPANSFRATIGTGATVADTITSLLTTVGRNADAWTEVVVQYTPTTSGNFHLGFNDFTPAASPHTGFVVLVDDVSIVLTTQNEMSIIANFPYTQIPATQFAPSAQARNTGAAAQTNVRLSATLNGTSIGQSAPVTVAPGTTSDLLRVTPTAEIAKTSHTMVLTVVGNEPNVGGNNTATRTFTGTENLFATDTLTAPNATGLGFPAPSTGSFAKVFEITQTTHLSTIQILFSQRAGEQSLTIAVYPMTNATTTSTTPLVTRTQNRVPGVVNVDFTKEFAVLEPGLYAVVLTQTGGQSADISADGNSTTGGWYLWNATGALAYQPGGQTFGSLGLRMIITNDVWVKTATSGENGTIDPAGEVKVVGGGDQTFTFIPNTGFEIDVVTVNGNPVTVTGNTHTVTNIIAHGTIHVTFRAETSILPIEESRITLYPNPVEDVLYIETPEVIRRIEIISQSGQVVKTIDGNVNSINVNSLPPGIYFIRITSDSGVSTQRIVKQ